jgi:aquaporin-4
MAVNSIQDVKSTKLWTAVVAEMLGTMFLVLVACGACAKFPVTAPPPHPADTTEPPSSGVVLCETSTDIVQISLAFGFSVGTIVWIICRVSGGHINPAVTFGFLVTRKITVVRAVLYIISQCVGALLGALILKVVSPEAANKNLGHSAPSPLVTVSQAFLIEMLITFVLVWTVFATCDSQRKDLNGSGPLAIGLSIAMCHLWAVPYTGSGMNPARVFGVAVISGNFVASVHWAYWVGPLLGAALAALLYDFALAVNATGYKLKGFFALGYEDSLYDSQGRKNDNDGTELPLKGRS